MGALPFILTSYIFFLLLSWLELETAACNQTFTCSAAGTVSKAPSTDCASDEGVGLCWDSAGASTGSLESNRDGASVAVVDLLPNTGLPSFRSGPGFAVLVGGVAFEVDPFRLFSRSFFLSASTAFTAVAWAASISEDSIRVSRTSP